MNKALARLGALAALALAIAVPPNAHAQASPGFRVGVGIASSGVTGRSLRPQGSVDATKAIHSLVGLKASAAIAGGDVLGYRGGVTWTIGAEVLLMGSEGAVEPYVGAGVAYTHAGSSGDHPFAQNAGIKLSVGSDLDVRGRELFLDVSPRFYGNVFHDRAVTRQLWLFTIGWRF